MSEQERERQPREHECPCTWCRRGTFNVDAVCDVCVERGADHSNPPQRRRDGDQ